MPTVSETQPDPIFDALAETAVLVAGPPRNVATMLRMARALLRIDMERRDWPGWRAMLELARDYGRATEDGMSYAAPPLLASIEEAQAHYGFDRSDRDPVAEWDKLARMLFLGAWAAVNVWATEGRPDA
jgi:hypothetical protein